MSDRDGGDCGPQVVPDSPVAISSESGDEDTRLHLFECFSPPRVGPYVRNLNVKNLDIKECVDLLTTLVD